MLDIISYITGHANGFKDGTGVVVMDSADGYTFTDDGNGNITIAKGE